MSGLGGDSFRDRKLLLFAVQPSLLQEHPERGCMHGPDAGSRAGNDELGRSEIAMQYLAVRGGEKSLLLSVT